MRTVKDLKEFLAGKPDDAALKISHDENELPGEDVCGFYYGEDSTGDQDVDGNDLKQSTVVISSYVHF